MDIKLEPTEASEINNGITSNDGINGENDGVTNSGVSTPKLTPKPEDRSMSNTPKRQKFLEPPATEEDVKQPIHEIVGGSTVRQYLNKNLTKHVLEGLRDIATTQPDKPLQQLGEFLIQRSKELEQ